MCIEFIINKGLYVDNREVRPLGLCYVTFFHVCKGNKNSYRFQDKIQCIYLERVKKCFYGVIIIISLLTGLKINQIKYRIPFMFRYSIRIVDDV